MQGGEFFERFFSDRGPFEPNTQNEASVLCPFEHEKGLEKRPSAHINMKKDLFHCKTCQAEGRFNEGGLSEIGFIAAYHNLTYEEAIRFSAIIEADDTARTEEEVWDRIVDGLVAYDKEIQYLADRGITLDTVMKYRLGYKGDGICYPVFIYGLLCDVRTYMPHETPKMRSRKGASPLLFPFDDWLQDERPTLLVGGENDCLLGRQIGFNALTVTGGEGVFPKIFLHVFRGKQVYMCYDCDEAGKTGAEKIAFLLTEAGAEVYMVDLGLPGTKEDKDLTDFVVKHGAGYLEIFEKLSEAQVYSQDTFVAEKNKRYPLVDLWNVPEGRYSGQEISSRVVLSGKYDTVMQAPTVIEWACKGPKKEDDNSPCHTCPLQNGNGWWMLEDRLKDLMEIVDVTEAQQTKAINKFIRMPDKCPNGEKKVRSRQAVYKVVFTPDVETEDILTGFRATEQYAYTIGMNLEDGARYRAYFRPYAHPLDGQRVFMVVHRVEESDNAINVFKMTPDIQRKLKIWNGDPVEVMSRRALMAKDIVGSFAPEVVVNAVDIMYHSPLEFKFNSRKIKGYPEGLIIGESRTGKSDTSLFLQRYYGVGNFTAVKRSSVAGLLGGADKLPSGGFKVNWGIIPRNHKGLVVLDEMSGLGPEVLASMTDMRSSGVATVTKIANGKAPAMTRMLWLSNPEKQSNGQSMSLRSYPTGVQAVLELVGSDEDVARFDFIMLMVTPDEFSSPIEEAEVKAYPSDIYRDLIYWVWSRSADQVQWGEGVEGYVWQISQELNEKYNTDVKFFGAEAWKKVARIAVACAGVCFSASDDGTNIIVTKSHVDWAAAFLRNCYDNPVFRLADYVRDRRVYSQTNEAVNTIVAGLCRTHPTVLRTLLQTTTPFPRFNLQSISGLDNENFNSLMATLATNYLVTMNAQGFLPTLRLRLAVEVYRTDYTKSRMIPVAQEGGQAV